MASAISGTIAFDTFVALSDPTDFPITRSTIAHWVIKHSSATVATERPINTLDSGVSNRQMR